jgi:replicative DNA helicase
MSNDPLRVPPNAVEAEQSVIGGLLLRPASLQQVAAIMGECDFYRRDHALIFRAICELDSKGMAADAVTLGEWFEAQGISELVGGTRYIWDLANNTPSAANILAYVRIVREKSMLRQVIDVATEIAGAAFIGDGEASTLVDEAIAKMMGMQRRDTRAEWSMRDVLRMAVKRAEYAYNHPGEIPGLPTGLTALDAHLGGLHNSDLTVIGARPAMGKTALLFGMARHAAVKGYPVGIISGEQPAVQLGARMLSLASGVHGSALRSGKLEDHDWSKITRAIESDIALPIQVFDKAAPNIAEVGRIARRWKHDHGIAAIYVDYLQRLDGPGEKTYERVSAVTKGLKNIARDLDIPVIALGQVKREVESRGDKRPRMSDLCDSSEIEKEADQIITIYRDDYYNDDSPDTGTAELLIDKNRHGECAKVRVAWLAQTMRFADLAQEWEPRQ